MNKVSKTKALKIAQSVHSGVQKFGYSYCFYSPYFIDQPHGPTTQTTDVSYERCKERRVISVACLALALMGYSQQEGELWYQMSYNYSGSAKERIEQYIAKHP